MAYINNSFYPWSKLLSICQFSIVINQQQFLKDVKRTIGSYYTEYKKFPSGRQQNS